MTEAQILRKLRSICLALSDTAETVTFGHPTFRVAGKTFCVVEPLAGEPTIALKVGLEHQDVFLKDRRFIRTPYVGRFGWVSLRVGGKVDWTEVAELVRDSYRVVAQKRRVR